VVGVDELVDVLDRERHVLESLVFRLIEAQGLLTGGEARFLGWAASDIEAAAAALREIECRRATIIRDMSTGSAPTMAMLVRAADEPWSALLTDHHGALGQLTSEVGAGIEAVHHLAGAGYNRVRAVPRQQPDAVGATDERPGTPEPNLEERPGHGDSGRSTDQPRPLLATEVDDLDREIAAAGYEAVLVATGTMVLPSLMAFLG